MYELDCDTCDKVQLAVDISKKNFRENHKIEICCQNMCRLSELKSLC